MSEEQYNPVVESAAIDADELMAKYDKESAYRRLTGFPSKLVFFLCVAWSVFQLYTGLFGTFPSTLQRAPHLAAAMTLVYLLYPISGKSIKPTNHIPVYDYILALASVGVGLYHIIFYDDLLLRRSLGDKSMQLLLEPGRTVTITHGDDTHTLTTEAERLSSLLRRSGIRLGEDEMVELNVAGEDPAIRISDTLTYQHYVTVETDYKILRSPDPLMDKGTEEIIRKGIPGQIVETYEDTVVSGEVVSTKYIGASHDTSHAELVRYGTRVYEVEEGDTIEKDFPNEVGEGGYLLFASGDTMTYNKVMLCSSTAYYSGGDGGAAWTTAVGAAVGVGTVAVDPKVIPYYTKMFIQTTNGRRVYGMGTALDCGGAVKGNIVDLWFPTKADCYSWGRRHVTVYILDKKAS